MKYYLEVQLTPGNWQIIDVKGSERFSEMDVLRNRLKIEYKGQLKTNDFRIVKR